jgi:hypothetical protein
MLTVYFLFNLPQQFVKPIVMSASRNLLTFCESYVTFSRVVDVRNLEYKNTFNHRVIRHGY